MAQSDLGTDTSPLASPQRVDRWLNIAVAVLIFAVVAGAAWFGYSVYHNNQLEDQNSATGRIATALGNQVRQSPNDAVLRVRYAEALGAMGKYQEAINQLNAALKIDPKHTGAYLDLGMVAQLTNNNSAAEGYYLKVIDLTDSSQYAGVDAQREQAFFNLGTLTLGEKRYADAAGYFKAALHIRSDASDTYYSLARAYQGLGDAEAAIQQLNTALQFDPSYAEAHYFLGQLYQQKKDDLNATTQFALAVKLAPGADPPKEALASYGSASDWMTKAHTALDQGDLEAALTDAKIALNIEADNVDAAKLVGQVYVERGELPLALSAYQAAAKLAPKDPDIQAQVAKLTAQVAALTPAKIKAVKKAAVKKAAVKKKAAATTAKVSASKTTTAGK